MTAKRIDVGAVRFRGSPPRVDALIQQPHRSVVTAGLAVRVDAFAQFAPERTHVQSSPIGDGSTRLRLNLPESTPPGTYKGTIQIDGEDVPMEVQVDPRVALTFSPSNLTLLAAPGTTADVDVTIANRGNVAAELPASLTLDLLQSEALPGALGAALRGDRTGKRDRVNRFADEMARHSAVLELEVLEGAGTLEPGAQRELRMRATFPEELEPGHSYVAVWTLLNQVYIVAVHAQAVRTTVERPKS